MIRMSLEDFLSKKKLLFPVSDYTLDKCLFPHGLPNRQRRALEQSINTHAKEYSMMRNAAIEEYNHLVEKGEIQPKSKIELMVEKARYGHPDNDSTQAARRMCVKRGIDWEAYSLE